MPYELPPEPSAERRARITRWASFAFAAVLTIIVTYLGYIGYEGSRQLTDAPGPSASCRTPAALGWDYEAINYDAGRDAALADESDPENCVGRGATAGDEIRGPGGVGIAAWYVPAGDGGDPSGPTVVLAHGWGSNKSNMLARAELLHPHYHLVLLDFRNHGQSQPAATTQGVREAGDLRAVLDWLLAEKGAERVAVFGVSMGGASALRHGATDHRVDVLVIESTHATLASAIESRLERAGYPLAVPGAWAAMLGALFRTGEDVTVADPIRSIERLDGRPLLLISGGGDTSIGADDAAAMLAAAEAAGSPVELHVCPDAEHAQSFTACAEEYPDWVLGFLERHLDGS
ncbi:MAG TPA: alpha/beta fold hydrolase [Candidatus Limnocylindrales bacterium]|nr:alpha/beta fold hydrolase [Candidatus Limnocylindrales bacterium]